MILAGDAKSIWYNRWNTSDLAAHGHSRTPCVHPSLPL